MTGDLIPLFRKEGVTPKKLNSEDIPPRDRRKIVRRSPLVSLVGARQTSSPWLPP